MSLIEFITAYRRQLIIVLFVATILFQLWMYIQKKHKWAEDWWFCMWYMLFNFYVPCMLFILLVGK